MVRGTLNNGAVRERGLHYFMRAGVTSVANCSDPVSGENPGASASFGEIIHQLTDRHQAKFGTDLSIGDKTTLERVLFDPSATLIRLENVI